jgi:glutathione S-transferase
MKLYDYDGSANAYKVRLLLAQLQIPHESVAVEIFRGESRTPEFLDKNPAGQVPVIELDDGTCLAQSNAILWHLGRGSALLPDDPRAQSRVLEWLFFEQSDVEPIIGSARFWLLTGRAAGREPELARRQEIGRRSLQALEQYLASRRFLVADRYTIADIAVYAYTHVAEQAGLELAPLSALRRWLERVEQQPRYIPGPGPYSASAQVG